MPYSLDKILHCYTANHKLKEARYWLEKMMEKDIFNDDDQFGWHLNAFCTAFASSIDYVHADFVYNKVKPRINWKEFSRSRQNKEYIIENHEQKDAICRIGICHGCEVHYFIHREDKVRLRNS